jgi:chromosome partitioning protein
MKLPRTQVIAFASQKGGCGKTTGSVSVAAALAQLGYAVTLIDVDAQCNATDTFGINRDDLQKQGRFTVADAYLAKKPISEIQFTIPKRFSENLSIVAGHRGLNAIQARIDAEIQARIAGEQASDLDADDLRSEYRQRLKISIASVSGKQDFVIIDTPPELGFLLTTALIAADWYVIPTFPSGYDLKGLEYLTKTIEKVTKRYNPRLRMLGVLIGNYDGRAKLDRDIQKMLAGMFGEERIFQNPIGRSVKHREATVYGLTIFEHAAGEPASQQYEALAREIVDRVAKAGGQGGPTPQKPQSEPEVTPQELPEVANG